MSLKLRRAFFFLYIGLFLLTAPLVVLWTAGFRYNFATKQLVQTGALSVSTIPKGADVTTNGKATGKRTPVIIKRALPGQYDLHIERDGYHAWTREVDVVSRQTTFVEDIVLFLDTEPELLLDVEPVFSSPSPDGDAVAYVTHTESWFELWTYRISEEQIHLVDRLSRTTTVDPVIEWSVNGDHFFLSFTQSETASERLHKFYAPSGPIESPFADVEAERQETWFDPLNAHMVHTRTTENELMIGHLLSGAVTTYEETIVDALPLGEVTLLLKTAPDYTSLVRSSGTTEETLALLEPRPYRFGGMNKDAVLLTLPEHQSIVLVDTMATGAPILLSATATMYHWTNDQLLYTDGFELHQYDPATNTDTLLTRTGNPIYDMIVYPRGQTVFIVNGSSVRASELSDLSRPVDVPILTSDQVDHFWIDRRGRVGYLLGTHNGQAGLHTLTLTETTNLLL